jgi:hypothetical protein
MKPVGAVAIGMRSPPAITRDRDIYELWIDPAELFVAETVLLRRPRVGALAEHLGLGDKFIKDFSPFPVSSGSV